MAMSKRGKRKCECGQAHLIAVYPSNEDYDEWSVPEEVHAFKSCIEINDFIEEFRMKVHGQEPHPVLEVMSSRRMHHDHWLEQWEQKFPKP